jgi:hypothetical protein
MWSYLNILLDLTRTWMNSEVMSSKSYK